MDLVSERAGGRGRTDGPRRNRATVLLWALGGLVATTLVVGAVAGALREPSPLDPDSPEGVIQAYLQAVFDHRFTDAGELFSAETAARCPVSDFRHAWVPESLTASLDEVSSDGGEAEVSVRIRTVAGPGPFGSGDYTSREVFTLVEEEDVWRITGDPWPLLSCRGP